MKKTYISPESFLVHFSMDCPLAVSTPNVSLGFDEEGIDAGEVEVKGTTNEVNVWDSEW